MMKEVVDLSHDQDLVNVKADVFYESMTTDGGYNVYCGERVYIRFYHTTTLKQIIINGVTYYFVKFVGGQYYYSEVWLDITDPLRVCLWNNTKYTVNIGEARIQLTFTPLAGISPDHLMLPKPIIAGAVRTDLVGAQILPPNIMYLKPELLQKAQILVELYGDILKGGQIQYRYGNSIQRPTLARQTVLSFLSTNRHYNYQVTINSIDTTYSLSTITLGDCDNACVLNWLSASGIFRQHIWRVKKIKHTTKSEDFIPFFNNYSQRKSIEISFVAYIEGLDSYSYAYYADIINSSEVYCLFTDDGNMSDYPSSSNSLQKLRVAVDTSNYTLLDGNSGELKTLEITIKYKKYDTI